MVTLKQINKAIKALGGEEELVKGDGYFYFEGGNASSWEQSGVYGVFRLNDLPLERWIDEYRHLSGRNLTHTDQ